MNIVSLHNNLPEFELVNRRSYSTECPRCSSGRRKQGTKSLSVYRDDDKILRYICHHPGCEWNAWQWQPDPHPTTYEQEVVALPKIPSGETIPETYNGDVLYWYRDVDGSYLFANRRINLDTGKVYVPFVYTAEGFVSGKNAKWPANYKGLFGAETINGKKKAIIVEGEKAARAAQEKFPHHAVVSWLGGANNTSKADWELLRDIESVLLWPDNDEAGRKVMREIASQLPVDRVLMADVSALPPKADLADDISDEQISVAIKGAFDLSTKIPGVFSVGDIKKQLALQGRSRESGYEILDATTKLPGSGLVVIEGRTKHGKSALAVALTSMMLIKGLETSVTFYSYEMTAGKVFIRYIKTLDTTATLENYEEIEATSTVSDWIDSGKLKIVDQGAQMSIADLVLLSSKPQMRGGVMVIDYLQIVPAATMGGRNSRQQMLKEMLDALRVAAHKNNVLVFVLSQLTPDYSDPRNDSPREAKDIHYSADLVLRIWNKSVGESHPTYANLPGSYIIHTYLNREGESNVKYEGSLESGSKLTIKRRIRDQ